MKGYVGWLAFWIFVFFVLEGKSHDAGTVSTYWLDSAGHAASRIVYSADRTSGTVHFRVTPRGDLPRMYPPPYKGCSVLNAENWSCVTPSYDIEADDGEVTGTENAGLHSVSFLRWWIARISRG